MHRYKIVPPVLFVLSLITFVLAAPVVLQEAPQACVDMAGIPEDVIPVSESDERNDEQDKRWDEYSDEPWQKRGSSSGESPAPLVGDSEPPADQELAQNSPPSPQTGTSRIHNVAPTSSPEINKWPPSDEEYSSSSGESYPSDHGYTSSENYLASDEGGPASSIYSDSSSDTRIIGVGSNGVGSLGSSKSYPPWNRPELASNMNGPWSTKSYPPSDGPGPDLASNVGRPGSSMSHPLANRPEEMVSTRPVPEPFPGWNLHDWSTTSSEPEPKNNFMSKTKSFLEKLVYKFKFWPRGQGVL